MENFRHAKINALVKGQNTSLSFVIGVGGGADRFDLCQISDKLVPVP